MSPSQMRPTRKSPAAESIRLAQRFRSAFRQSGHDDVPLRSAPCGSDPATLSRLLRSCCTDARSRDWRQHGHLQCRQRGALSTPRFPGSRPSRRGAREPAGKRGVPFSPPDFLDLARDQQSFTGVAAYTNTLFELSGGSAPTRIVAAKVSANLFSVLDVTPALGRGFTPDDDRPGREALIS